MSDALVGALIGALAALAGTTVTFLLESSRRDKERAADATDALRNQRAAAYRSYVAQVHLAAHNLARSAAEPDRKDARVEAAALVNREVVGALMELEVLAPADTLEVARNLRDILREFRSIVEAGGSSTSEEWIGILARYRERRSEFLALARREIL